MQAMAGTTTLSLDALSPRHIALLKPSALGDIVHSLPVLTGLRRRYPRARITWIVNRAYEPLLRGHPDLDATLPFDRGALRQGFWAGVRAHGRFLGRLRRQRFDLVIDLQGLLRTGVIAWASGARRRLGLEGAREGARWFYTDVIPIPDRDSLHAVDRYWRVARALGAGDTPPPFRLPLADPARRWAEQLLAGYPRPWLMLGVGARWQTKRWPPEHFAALARQSQERHGGTVFFVGSREETPAAQAVRQSLTGPSRDLTGQTSLPQLAAVLAQADLMLANDTGPLHLAVALGRPVVAPYTCTRVQLTGPYHAAGGAIETGVWCQGSYLKRCTRLECMAELTPARLWPLVEEVLHPWPIRLHSA
jgi:lipopolysaccharide heptosyltransferase I